MQFRLLSILFTLSSFLSSLHAFLPLLPASQGVSKSVSFYTSSRPLFAVDEETTSTEETSKMMEDPEALETRDLNFQNNRRAAWGSTIDEDGKSNVWSTNDKNESEIDQNSNPNLVLGFLGVGLVAMVAAISQLNFVSGDI